MIEPTSAALTAFLGMQAANVIGAAVKDHVQKHLGKLLTAGEKKLLGKKETEALQLAYESVLTHAYTRTLNALGRVLELTGISFPQFVDYQQSVERFVRHGAVAEHLVATVRDLSDTSLPDPALLDSEWQRLDGKPFPTPGVWIMVAANFRASAKEKAFVTPHLREVLNAQNLDAIKSLQQKLLGVQVTVRHEQYIDRMRIKYAGVELANVAPSYAEDPGRLVVTDVFEPQHVRENPPPVEITKDEFEKLAREGKIDKNDEEAIIALLEDGEGQQVAQRLRFQRASYAEQPVRPVLDVIAGTMHVRSGIVGWPMSSSSSPHRRLIVITGEPGSGKSTLMRYLLLGVLDPPVDPNSPDQPLPWTEEFTGDNDHFPLLIELRDYYFTCKQEPGVNSFLDYVNHLGETQGYGIDALWLKQRLTDGPSLVMFDGLDEIFDAGDRDRIMHEIVGFTGDHERARVIVTSRPHGYHEGILRPAGFAHFRLQDLDRKQTEHFTRGWFQRVFPNSPKDAQQRIDRVLTSIDRSASVRWLAGNPLLLTIMCMIAREKELPRERARFYEQCIDVLVHQWEINNHLKDENLAFLDVEDKKGLLRRIAFHMQSSAAGLRGNFIAEGELLAITQAWFVDTFEDHKGAKARQAAKQMVKGLWERNYLLCPRGPKLYGFLHRTFMEFLTATEYVRRFEKTPEFTLDDLDAVFRQHGNEPEWQEVLRLICGEVGDEYADRLIRTLLTLKEFPTDELTEENQPNHLVLAIRCMSELRGLSKMEALGAFAFAQSVKFLNVVISRRYPNEFLTGTLIDAVCDVGPRWPGKTEVSRVDVSRFVDAGHETYPEFDAAIFQNEDRIAEFLAHEKWYVRASAIQALARSCPSDATRQFLSQCAVEDEDYRLRVQALALLAGSERWADDATRQLLIQRAVEDDANDVRVKALELLAGSERWADDATRQLLSQRAVEDEYYRPRVKALELLAGSERWAEHEETLAARQRFIEECIRDAAEPEQRGRVACAWLGSVGSFDVPEDSPLPLDKLRNAARRVFSKDADGIVPFLDPRQPVSGEHLAKVARYAGLSEADIEPLVEQINHALGWDIRQGVKA